LGDEGEPAVIDVQLREQSTGSGPVCRAILGALPQWFGIPASVENYVAMADRSPTVIASRQSEDVGILTVVRHGPHSAEIAVMAVMPALHGQGIGGALLGSVEASLAGDGVEFLQVKTLSASSPDEGYEKTRAFYSAHGFRTLEELPDLWGPDNPAVLMVKVVSPVTGPT
jgi:ribosomal protein S18 acetylase RimI-like enzyme